MGYKILLADDEAEIRDVLRIYLEKDGYVVTEAADGVEAMNLLKKEPFDLVILDIMMPGVDGYRVLRSIRETNNVPVIMLSAKGTESDKILGLDLGADDYLVKPFGMMEMVSRVRAVLRRCQKARSDTVLHAGNVCLNTDQRTVTADGEEVRLTYKEFEVLKLFMEHPGTVFTRDRLFGEVWGEDFVGETRTVDMHIRTLRQKLGESGAMIETVRNVGYRMSVRP